MALGLALALVIARGTMQEYLRELLEVQPGSDLTPKAPGAAASIGLDLLCCVPAMLVLLRRALDRHFTLRIAWSALPLGLLCGWMLLSTIWAADKFAALITACHWTAAAAMLWAMAQLVRDGVTLRLVAALLFSLLPIYAITGLETRFLEHRDTVRYFESNRPKVLAEQGLAEGSFGAKQFEEQLRWMETFGFFSSP